MARTNGYESLATTATRSRLGRVGRAGVGFAARDGGYSIDDYAAGPTGRYGSKIVACTRKTSSWADTQIRSRHSFDPARHRPQRRRQGHLHVP